MYEGKFGMVETHVTVKRYALEEEPRDVKVEDAGEYQRIGG